MSFQLFPPPPKKQRPINLQRPAQPASPESAVELLERAKVPVDFHELVIKVNSNPASPVESPPQAHVASSIAGKSQPRVPVSGSSKSTSQSNSPQTRTRSSSFRSGNGRTTPTSGTSLDNTSPGKDPSISEDTISPLSQADRQYTASPSFSDATTLVRNQSTATHRTKLSQTSPKEPAVMRSIFPRYNPSLPLSQQQYKPTQASPTDIPKEKISRKPYSPTFYVPHADVLRSGSAEEPYYTPKIELGALWDAANGKARPEGWRTYALQMHCRKASPSNSPVDGDSFTFGSSPVQPFYNLEQALIDKDTNACEVLISRNNPMQPKNDTDSLPIAHLSVQTPPPHGPPPPPEVFYERPDLIPQATHITTITPKPAILAALEEAAQGPRGAEIASIDPKAESPAAAALAAEAIAACEALNGCQLLHCPVSEPLMPPYEADKTGTYELRHPRLGAFPVVVQGDVKRSLEAALETARKTKGNGNNKTGTASGQNNSNTTSSVAVRSTSPVSHIPTTITMLNPFAAPRSSTITTDSKQQKHNSYYYNNNYTTDRPASPAPDEVLARLSLHTATLTIDAAAIAALGADKTSPHAHSPHPHMIDVAVSAVMAVLVAERRREHPPHAATPTGAAVAGGGSPGQVLYGGGTWPSNGSATSMPMVFEGPPTAAARRWPGMETVGPKELVMEKVKPMSWGWWFGTTEEKEAKKAAKRDKKRSKGVVDIEMGQGPNVRGAVESRGTEAQGKGKQKGKGDDEGMHWLVELIFLLLVFAFKVVWFVLSLLFKVLGKAVGVVNRCAAKH